MFSILHSFSNSIRLRQKSSGVSGSICLVQKNSPRLWYVLRFGRKCSLNNHIYFFIAILYGSLLYSALVIWYRASGPMPHIKFSCNWFTFVANRFVLTQLPGIILLCLIYVYDLYIAGIFRAMCEDFLSVAEKIMPLFPLWQFDLCCSCDLLFLFISLNIYIYKNQGQVAGEKKLKNLPSCHIFWATWTATGTTPQKNFPVGIFFPKKNLVLPGAISFVCSLKESSAQLTKKLKKLNFFQLASSWNPSCRKILARWSDFQRKKNW